MVKLLLLAWVRDTDLMNVEFEESGKSMGTATKIVDDIKQKSAHMNSESRENVEVNINSI